MRLGYLCVVKDTLVHMGSSRPCTSIAACSFVLKRALWLALFVLLVLDPSQPAEPDNPQMRLVNTLFEGYNELIRPVRNTSELLKVDFQMALHQLINVDEKNQILKSNVWLRMVWYDYQLLWDPGEYDGIGVIRIQPDRVWKPDIVLFNNADGKYEVSFKPNLVIYDNGKVLWIPPAIYKSSCTINVEYFPFDEQKCQMNFGSWTFNDLQVVLGWYEGQQKVDLEDYSPSGSWDLISCPGELSSQEKDGQHNVSTIIYELTIRRKTLFYTVNLILPCVLITFLSFCVFFLPADAHEKMTMCISILLALVVFLVLVSKILPPSSVTTPLIAKYLLFTFIMNFVTIIITVVIINWNFRTPRTHKMPRWVREVFLNYLPRAILMKRPDHDTRWREKSYTIRHHVKKKTSPSQRAGSRWRDEDSSTRGYFGGDDRGAELLDGQDFFLRKQRNGISSKYSHKGFQNTSFNDSPESLRNDRGPTTPATDFPFTRDAINALEAVKFVAAHLKNEDDYSEILDDWRYVASVIDRLLLYIFVAITVGGTLGILIDAPHIFETIDQEKLIQVIKASKDGYGLPRDDVPSDY